MSNREEFYEDFRSEIHAKAHALDEFRSQVFVAEAGDMLVEAGELVECHPASYKSRGVQIDGYYYDLELGQLNLIVAAWLDEESPTSITNSEIEKYCRRGISFVEKSKRGLAARIDISAEAHDLADLIEDNKKELETVKIILLTDGLAKRESAVVSESDGIEITRVVWDLDRLHRFWSNGELEPIVVDFERDFGGAIPVVCHESAESPYQTYLGFVPGDVLAAMYEKWGTRLLEMNVRVFLQSLNKVNRGMRDTLRDEPEMFLAFNNGITVISESVELSDSNGQLAIGRAQDFQIVNGGQTCASLFHGRKKHNASLDATAVQMKLTVVRDGASISTVVPRISLYSNTQNKIQRTDLAANDPPHPELESISRRLPAPDPTGGSRQTYWFYERARGSYQETRNLEVTPAKKRGFDQLYPKGQRFDKNALGKSWMTWMLQPHTVSLGAQKNFGNFNAWLSDNRPDDMEVFFRKTVALVMIWKAAERIVQRQKFQGYRHNIVTYTLSWLFHLVDRQIDLQGIWQHQVLPEGLEDLIEAMCETVNDHIRDTTLNVTEWCKKEECWMKLKETSYAISERQKSEIAPDETLRNQATYSDRDEEEAIESCSQHSAEEWKALAKWLKAKEFLSNKERSQAYNIGKALGRGKRPSKWLAIAGAKIWEKALLLGWDPEEDTADTDES